MYLVVGHWRVPWAFRPWRGKDTITPAQLGLKLLRTLRMQCSRVSRPCNCTKQRFVISTRVFKGSTITWWGRRRWAIEGFFKTAKYQFGLASFGQQTLLGVYRWLILSFISFVFVLTHWVYLSLNSCHLPDWKKAALLILQKLLPAIAINLLLIEIETKRELLASQGMALKLVSIQI